MHPHMYQLQKKSISIEEHLIEYRIRCARNNFAHHNKQLQNENITLKTRVTIVWSDRDFHTDIIHGTNPTQKYRNCQWYTTAF